MSALHTVFFGFIMLLFELSQFLSYINHLTGISATCLLPGLPCKIEVLSWLVHRATVLREPATLNGTVSCEGSICRVAPLAISDSTVLLGCSFTGTPLMCTLLGHALSRFGGCCSSGLVGSGFLVLVPPRKW